MGFELRGRPCMWVILFFYPFHIFDDEDDDDDDDDDNE